MNFTDAQEKPQVISDVSSDDDARELAKLGKKPVLRVCVTCLSMVMSLTFAAELFSPCHSWTLVYFDGYLGGHVQRFCFWASERRPIRAYIWVSICLDRLRLRCCNDGRARQHVADSWVS